MSLNKIQLSNRHLTDLYPNVLVEIKHATSVPDNQAVKYLGKNESRILLLVSHEGLPFLPDPELAFLTSILSACRLGLANVAIVNIAGMDEARLRSAITELDPVNVLLFGIEPLDIHLPIHFPFFQLQSHNKRMYLSSPTLGELERDKALKLQLWNSLKKMFAI